MPVKSFYRGQPIVYDENRRKWVFEEKDTFLNDEIDKCKTVRCVKCNEYMKSNEPDQCLGHLKGVINACCGHGKQRGYIIFENGKKISFENVRVEKV